MISEQTGARRQRDHTKRDIASFSLVPDSSNTNSSFVRHRRDLQRLPQQRGEPGEFLLVPAPAHPGFGSVVEEDMNGANFLAAPPSGAKVHAQLPNGRALPMPLSRGKGTTGAQYGEMLRAHRNYGRAPEEMEHAAHCCSQHGQG